MKLLNVSLSDCSGNTVTLKLVHCKRVMDRKIWFVVGKGEGV